MALGFALLCALETANDVGEFLLERKPGTFTTIANSFFAEKRQRLLTEMQEKHGARSPFTRSGIASKSAGR